MQPRTRHRTLRLLAVGTGAAALVLVGAGAASAHVTVTPSSTAAGSESVLTFQVPHGCDGSPTTRITIRMPDQIVEATPTRNPYYTVSKQTEKLARPLTAEDGDQITEKVDTVTYTATTPLPDGYRDAFEILVDVPEDMAGRRLSFPTIQTCEQGETDWTQIPAAGQDPETLDDPAPGFDVTAAGADADPDPGSGGADGWGYAGTALGAVGLGLGGAALTRTRRPR